MIKKIIKRDKKNIRIFTKVAAIFAVYMSKKCLIWKSLTLVPDKVKGHCKLKRKS